MKKRALGAWSLIAVLTVMLIAAVFFAYQGLVGYGDFKMQTSDYVALAFGVVCSLIVGIGLMALIFYSSRHGYDEPAQLIPDDPDGAPSKRGQ